MPHSPFVVRLLFYSILFVVTVTSVLIITGNQLPARQAAIYPYQRVTQATAPLHPLLVFDSEHYYNIAAYGYQSYPMNQAFFPLYPLLVRGLSYITSTHIAMLVISAICIPLSAIFLFLWARVELRLRGYGNNRTPFRMLLLIAIFPTSFFLVMGYNESLFIFLSAASLYFYRTDRPWLAGIFAAFSTATRVQGCMIVLVFLLEYLLAKQWYDRYKLIPLLMAPLGIVAFMAYQWQVFGNPVAFVTAQHLWGKFSDNYLYSIASSISPSYIFFYIPILAFMLYLTYKKLGAVWLTYCVAPFLLCIVSGSLVSINRYALSAFPLFLALAIYLPTIKQPLQIGLIFTCVIGLLMNISLVCNTIFIG